MYRNAVSAEGSKTPFGRRVRRKGYEDCVAEGFCGRLCGLGFRLIGSIFAEALAEESGGRSRRKRFAEEFYTAAAVEGGFCQHSNKLAHSGRLGLTLYFLHQSAEPQTQND